MDRLPPAERNCPGSGWCPRGFTSLESMPCVGLPGRADSAAGGAVPAVTTGTSVAPAATVPPGPGGQSPVERAPLRTPRLGPSHPHGNFLAEARGSKPQLPRPQRPGVSPTQALSPWDRHSPFHPSARGLRGVLRALELLWNPKEGRSGFGKSAWTSRQAQRHRTSPRRMSVR